MTLEEALTWTDNLPEGCQHLTPTKVAIMLAAEVRALRKVMRDALDDCDWLLIQNALEGERHD